MSELSDGWDAVTAADLRAWGSLKWTVDHPEALGAWVAEMDFGIAPALLEALADTVARAEFGYPTMQSFEELAAATADWYRDRYGWTVDPTWIAPIADVVKGLELAITEFSAPGAPVIVPTPAYMPFLSIPPLLGRDVLAVPMLRAEDGSYVLDLPAIASAMEAGGSLVVLANPGNPTGKVYTSDELVALAALVAEHGGRVFADEIHAPLTLFGNRHVPFASVSEAAARIAITATSASKSWNLAGLKCAQLILTNDVDRDLWVEIGPYASHGASTPGIRLSTAAYRDGAAWLAEVVAYLEGNYLAMRQALAERLPLARLTPLQGTYLSWLDLSAYPVDGGHGAFLLEHTGVMVNEGADFGDDGAGFVRINIATPRPILIQIVDRIAAALVR